MTAPPNRAAHFRIVLPLLLCGLAGCGATRQAEPAATPPALQLTATPPELDAGATTTLNWNARNVNRCVASGDWSGDVPASGSRTLTPPQGMPRYVLTCTGSAGAAEVVVQVRVNPAPDGRGPALTLAAAPLDSVAGTPVTLSWSSSDATACTASEGWSGPRTVAGTETVTPPPGSTRYQLTCTGAGGAVEKSIVVTVRPLGPPDADDAFNEFNRVQQLEQGCCNAAQ